VSAGGIERGRRILVVDDNEDILRDFRKVLCPTSGARALKNLEDDLFGDAPSSTVMPAAYETAFARSGRQALDMARDGLLRSKPFAVAFVDMRMPGWDGVETIKQLWRVQPTLEVAICSAFMDYSWQEVIDKLERPGLRLIRKPWTTVEVLEVVHDLLARAGRQAGRTVASGG
jgi:CheY-like chemotaxis protein